MTQYYVGVKKSNYHCDIFTSKTTPTTESHGNKYAFCFGGYATKRSALRVAMSSYVIDNPANGERCKAEYNFRC